MLGKRGIFSLNGATFSQNKNNTLARTFAEAMDDDNASELIAQLGSGFIDPKDECCGEGNG